MLEHILNELNRIIQLDIYYTIDDQLLNIDIYINEPYSNEISNDVMDKLHHYLTLSSKEINNHTIYLSFYTLMNDSLESFINKIKKEQKRNLIKDNIYFGNIDHYLYDKNILIKKIYLDKCIYILEFTNDTERNYVYKYLSQFNLKIDIKDTYYKYKCKSLKIIKEISNDRDYKYFFNSEYLFNEY